MYSSCGIPWRRVFFFLLFRRWWVESFFKRIKIIFNDCFRLSFFKRGTWEWGNVGNENLILWKVFLPFIYFCYSNWLKWMGEDCASHLGRQESVLSIPHGLTRESVCKNSKVFNIFKLKNKNRNKILSKPLEQEHRCLPSKTTWPTHQDHKGLRGIPPQYKAGKWSLEPT